MILDTFANATDSVVAPATYLFPIVPSDIAEVERVTKGIYIGSAGDLSLLSLDGAAPVTFSNVAAGTVLDVRVLKVMQSGTTAGALVGLA